MDRTHLIAREFGGSSEKESIVPMFWLNNQSDMKKVEAKVRKLLNAKERVYYLITPRYDPGEDVPKYLDIYIKSTLTYSNPPIPQGYFTRPRSDLGTDLPSTL